MTSIDHKPTPANSESDSDGDWHSLAIPLLFCATVQRAWGRLENGSTADLCEAFLDNFEVILDATDEADAVRILLDAYDGLAFPGYGVAMLADGWNWLSEGMSTSADERFFEACKRAYGLSGAGVIEELTQAFDCVPREGTGEVLRIEALFRTCEWAIQRGPQPKAAVRQVLDAFVQVPLPGWDQATFEGLVEQWEALQGRGQEAVVAIFRALRKAVEEADDPVSVLKVLGEACAKAAAHPLAGDPVIGSLSEKCIGAIDRAGHLDRAKILLWESYNLTVFDERHWRIDEVMEAFKNAIYTVKEPARLIDVIFDALNDAVVAAAEGAKWLPDSYLVAYGCLAAIEAERGAAANVEVALDSVAGAVASLFDESATVQMLAQLYKVIVVGRNAADEPLAMTIDVLEKTAQTTRNPSETAEVLFQGLTEVAKLNDNPDRVAHDLCFTVLTNPDIEHNPWDAMEPLLHEAKEVIVGATNQIATLTPLLKELRHHRPFEPATWSNVLHWIKFLV